MHTRRIFLALAITVQALAIGACNDLHAPVSSTGSSAGGGSSVNGSQLTYTGQIQAVFQNRCKFCHNDTSSIPNWLNYDVAFSKRNLIYQKVVVERSMPMPPYDKAMTDAERKLIGDWIQEGAPKDDGTDVNPPANPPSGPAPAPAPAPTAAPTADPAPAPTTDPAPAPTGPVWNGGGIPHAISAGSCFACHGDEGNPAMSNFPRLAGQLSSYIETELKAIRDGSRQDPDALSYMVPEAKGLSDNDISLIASYYSQQKPQHGTSTASAAVIEKGHGLFDNGNPSTGLMACATCHGANGEGMIGPRIAGQGSSYLLKQYDAFKQNTRHEATTMPSIVQPLTRDEMSAIAAYLEGK